MTALPYRWDGEALVPLKPALCDKELVVGVVYLVEPETFRSRVSHDHQFAWLGQAWLQLPEGVSERFSSPLHLRKAALIEAGYYDETIIDCGSEEVAARVAAHIARRDQFAHVVVREHVVVERVAKSQRRGAMNTKDFQDSKQKVLEIVAGLVGVAPEELEREAGNAA
jgi:hypothetical protein